MQRLIRIFQIKKMSNKSNNIKPFQLIARDILKGTEIIIHDFHTEEDAKEKLKVLYELRDMLPANSLLRTHENDTIYYIKDINKFEEIKEEETEILQ